MEKIHVLITGIGGGGHGRQVLKALRLSSLNLYIVGCDISRVSIGLLEVDKPYLVPPANDKNYLTEILNICTKEKIKIIITGSEPELKVISQNRKRFLEQGILPFINTAPVIEICMDKEKTIQFLKKNDFVYAAYYCIKEIEEAKKPLHADLRFPVVIKPSVGGGGSSLAYIAQTQKELSFFSEYILKQGKSILVQQYIGSHREEYTVGVLSDFHGDILSSIVIKRNILSGLSNHLKIKEYNTGRLLTISSGISQGDIIYDEFLQNCCEKVAKALGSKGPINIQCRRENNKIYIFEINPRFSGTTSLRAMVGLNEVEILIRKELLKERVNKIRYLTGTIMRGLEEKYYPAENV